MATRPAIAYQRTLTDVVALQVDVAQSIAERIRANIGPAHETRRAPAVPINREAYEAFLLGGYFCNRNASDSRQKGIEHFQAAIRADGSYAPAHEGLARCYALLGEQTCRPTSGEPGRKHRRARPSRWTRGSARRTPCSPTCGTGRGSGRKPNVRSDSRWS